MIAYFDCFSGISGDMTLGAFLDLGVSVEWLSAEISRLPLDGFKIRVEKVYRHGISSNRVDVSADEQHVHRDYAHIRELIKSSPLAAGVTELSLTLFDKIATAEAAIHGCPKEKVHFHEVGGIDALVDIVGCALCVEKLGIEKVVSSPIAVGTGLVNCQHGTLPVPAPATMEMLRNAPIYGSGIESELVTPTGAAIITALAQSYGPMPSMKVERIGYGAGMRDHVARPNVLRIVLGKSEAQVAHGDGGDEAVSVVEATIDDMNPEIYGYLMERLQADGALDVCLIPVYMKKNRPGTLIQVICTPEKASLVGDRILNETTSLGIRIHRSRRRVLQRSVETVTTSYGDIEVKTVWDLEGRIRRIPEYEVCRTIALERRLPVRMVYEAILREIG